ncbi:uncharacterized protein LOC144142233 [Haemaphysalis longicornis]
MADLDIGVTPHRSINSSQGVISEPDLINETEAGLLEGLKGEGVTAVRRITMRRDDKQIMTKHIILTFDRSTLPESIKAGFIHCSVRPYIPNPRRCFKCQRFGHGTTACRGQLTCAKCAQHDHASDNCPSQTLICANCQGPHWDYYRTCEKFKQEKEIIRVKVTENLTFLEARKRFASFPLGRYADAARRGRSGVWFRRGPSTTSRTWSRTPPPPPLGCLWQPNPPPHHSLSQQRLWWKPFPLGPVPLPSLPPHRPVCWRVPWTPRAPHRLPPPPHRSCHFWCLQHHRRWRVKRRAPEGGQVRGARFDGHTQDIGRRDGRRAVLACNAAQGAAFDVQVYR